MLGTIGFKGYRINCIVGTESHEKSTFQDLLVDLKVEIDFTKVSASGQLKDTVNYVALAQICKELAVNGKYELLEKYASDVLEALFKQFAIESAWIKIEKPSAISGAECAFVELKRE